VPSQISYTFAFFILFLKHFLYYCSKRGSHQGTLILSASLFLIAYQFLYSTNPIMNQITLQT
jgi:hypothetical protein